MDWKTTMKMRRDDVESEKVWVMQVDGKVTKGQGRNDEMRTFPAATNWRSRRTDPTELGLAELRAWGSPDHRPIRAQFALATFPL